jgi:hypothetical protein
VIQFDILLAFSCKIEDLLGFLVAPNLNLPLIGVYSDVPPNLGAFRAHFRLDDALRANLSPFLKGLILAVVEVILPEISQVDLFSFYGG